jgi:hypothetical protein
VNELSIVCPNHAGSFDCTPFCYLCEGNQELSLLEYLRLKVLQAEGDLATCHPEATEYLRGHFHALAFLLAELSGPTPLPCVHSAVTERYQGEELTCLSCGEVLEAR